MKRMHPVTKRILSLFCVAAVISSLAAVAVNVHDGRAGSNVRTTLAAQSETIEMKEKTVVPEGAIGMFRHGFGGAIGAGQKRLYQVYNAGTISNTSEGLKYTAKSEDNKNGVRTDISEYIKKGVSGDIFGASTRVKVVNWGDEANRNNKAELFIEVYDAKGSKKATYPLASGGPNSDCSNLTSANSKVGADWLNTLLSGTAAITYDDTDSIYLCITQKNKSQVYADICLWGNISRYTAPSRLHIQTPQFDEANGKVSFSLENLTDKNVDCKITINHYKDNKPSSVDEYDLAVPSGTESTDITLAAEKGSQITIKDTEGTTYFDRWEPGSYDWVGTWASSQLEASGDNLPPSAGLANNTYRQFIRTSTGGTQIRLKFSNLKGTSPLEIKSVHIADQIDVTSSDIDTSTDTKVTFQGSKSVTIPAGGTVMSDVIDYAVRPLQHIAVTSWFGKVPAQITSHTGARCNNYFTEGNRVSDSFLGVSTQKVSWYFLEEMDVMSPKTNEAIVCFGDSITDGYGTTPDKYQRWTDKLAEQLQADAKTSHLSVLNEGIGGNSIFGGLGDAGKDRFDRDVIDKPGVKYVVMLIGINDIGYANELSVADSLIAEYKKMITKARDKGIKVYMATILPFKGNSYYSANEGPIREQIRQKVNQWILKESGADEVIDLAAAIASETDSEKMAVQYANDYLHPNAKGYAYIGELVYKAIAKNYQ